MKIIYVEDDDVDAELFTRYVKPYAFEITRFRNLDEIVDTNKCAVALLDLSVGKTFGVETVKEFKSRFPFIPFVVLSGNSDERMVEQCIAAGAGAYFDKNDVRGNGKEVVKKLVDSMLEAMGKETSHQSALKQSIEKLEDVSKQLAKLVGTE